MGRKSNFELEITGGSDSDFTKDPTIRKSIGGWYTALQGVPYTGKSEMQKFVTLSVTEAECISATNCVQDVGLKLTFYDLLD